MLPSQALQFRILHLQTGLGILRSTHFTLLVTVPRNEDTHPRNNQVHQLTAKESLSRS